MSRMVNDDELEEQFDSTSRRLKIVIGSLIFGVILVIVGIWVSNNGENNTVSQIFDNIKSSAHISQPRLSISLHTERNEYFGEMKWIKITSLESDTIWIKKIVVNDQYVVVAQQLVRTQDYNDPIFQSEIAEMKNDGTLVSDSINSISMEHKLTIFGNQKLAMGEFIDFGPGNLCKYENDQIHCPEGIIGIVLSNNNVDYVKIDILTDHGEFSKDLSRTDVTK